MSLAASLCPLEDDLTCPVCCEIFTEPVLLPCSHTFCSDCLQQVWRQGKTQDCPLCRQRSSTDKPPKNLALRSICETLLKERELSNPLGPTEKEPAQDGSGGSLNVPKDICKLHSEKLQLFCMEDKCMVCVECIPEHKDHSFCSVGKATGQLREEFRAPLEALQDKFAVVSKAKLTCVEMVNHIGTRALHAERQVKEVFKELHCFLRQEEIERIAALRGEEGDKSREMKDKINELDAMMSAITQRIKEVEAKLAEEGVMFLQIYKDMLDTGEMLNLTRGFDYDTEIPSGALMDVAKHLGNLRFHIWKKMLDHVEYTPVVLDPNTAYPFLSLSKDLTSVTCNNENQNVPDNPERFNVYSDILGSVGFTSGTHSWDVELGDNNNNWMVGVAIESVSRKVMHEETPDKSGLWAVGVVEGELRGIKQNVHRIRVHLDWDLGDVSFYSLTHQKKAHHLVSFESTFTENVYPYFYSYSRLEIVSSKISVVHHSRSYM